MPPSVKVRIKGKPSSKKKVQIDTSIRYDQSYFEIVQSGYNSIFPVTWSSVKILNEDKLLFCRVNVKHRLLDYDVSFPSKIQHFIHNVVNVESDGHCEFCTFIALLDMSEHNWGCLYKKEKCVGFEVKIYILLLNI